MRFCRTLFALTLMLAVAGLPLAGAAPAGPAAAGALGSAPGPSAVDMPKVDMPKVDMSKLDMSVSGTAHDCCPEAEMPCGKGLDGCAGMAACATLCIPWLAGASSRLDYGPALVSRIAAKPGSDLRSLLGDPPLRPPRV